MKHRIRTTGQNTLFWFLSITLVISTAGCRNASPCFVGTSITVPASDSTAPASVGMDIYLPNEPMVTVTDISGPITKNVDHNAVINLIAVGNDPDGVRDIQIWVEETWWFDNTQQGPDLLGAPEKNNPDTTQAGGIGCSARLTTLNLDIRQRSRQATAYRIRAWATAVNFAGMETKTAEVTFSWP